VSRDRRAIEARGVSRVYRTPAGSTEALRAVDAGFAPGAIGAIVGPSGSGKSTLLRLLGGLDVPDEGTVAVAGTDLATLGSRGRRRYRRNVAAYVAQRAASSLVPHLTVREQLERRGDAIAAELGIAERLDARADELSGGQQARAALAVALSRGTEIVLVDEPTAELDRAASARVAAVLGRAAAEGRTVVVATHDPELVSLAATTLELGPGPRASSHCPRSARSIDGVPVIAARVVTKRYGDACAVDAASLEVTAGELSVLVGRSGSGKSTLLMILAGFVDADAGATETPGRGWQETAYLAQRFGLLPELTIAENVDLPRRLRGSGLEPPLEALRLGDVAERLPAEASVGQQQRAALARALVGGAPALLVDEPTSHQDAESAEGVWEALGRACDEGAACLVATHDESAAARADRVWRIADGRVVAG